MSPKNRNCSGFGNPSGYPKGGLYVLYSHVLLIICIGGVCGLTGCTTTKHETQSESPRNPTEKRKGLRPEEEKKAKALSLYAEGIRAETNDSLQEAIESFRKAIDLAPRDQQIYKKLAACFIRNNKLEEGMATFDKLVQQHPASHGAHRWFALICQFKEDDDLARKHYRKAIEIKPELPAPYVELAMIHHKNDQIASALKILSKAIENAPTDSFGNILQLTGKLYLQNTADKNSEKGLLQENRRLLKEIGKKAGDQIEILYSLPNFYRKAKDLDLAEKNYRRIISKSPAESEAYRGLARVYLQQDRPKDALDLLEKAKDLAKKPHEIVAFQAQIHKAIAGEAGDLETAAYHREKAIAALESIPLARGKNFKRKFGLIQLYAFNQHFKQAIETVLEMEKLHPDVPELRFFAVQTIVAAAREETDANALLIFEIADHYDENPRALSLLAEILAGLEKLETANKLYSQALELGKFERPETYVRAAVIAMQNESEIAIEILQTGLAQFPNSAPILSALGQIRMDRGEFEQAVAQFEKVHSELKKEEKRRPTPLFTLQYAIALQNIGEIEKATDLLDRPEFFEPAFMQTYLTLAKPGLQEKAKKSIYTVLKSLHRRNPESAVLPAYIGTYLRDNGSLQESVKYFEKAISILESQKGEEGQSLLPLIYFQCGSAFERAGEFDKAERYLEKCIELDPEFAEAYNYLAYTWAINGIKLDKAQEYIEKALQLEPGTAAFIDTLGWIHFMRGNDPAALQHLEKAQELIPDDPTVLEHLGNVHEKLGNTEKAIHFWKKSLQLNPANPKLEERLRKHSNGYESS